MRAHYFQHVPFEGLGSLAPWLDSAGHQITGTRFYEPVELPVLSDIGLLIVMGGPMSANDEAEFPWLIEEKDYIRRAVSAGTPVLGVCLGAQLIASALGCPVFRNTKKEIGWFPINGVVPSISTGHEAFRFPPYVEVFHWHGETFELPEGAIRLARSDACNNQAFQYGNRVIGLQFHLETTPESASEIVRHCRAELVPEQYVQAEETILEAGPERYRTINELMGNVLSFLLR